MITISSLLFLSGLAVNSFCSVKKEYIELPVYPPRMTIELGAERDSVKRIQPNLQFSRLLLYAPARGQQSVAEWKPQSVSEAAYALRELLPKDFYDRMLRAYSSQTRTLSSSSDAAINERIGDLSHWVDDNWNGKWMNSENRLEGSGLLKIVEFTEEQGISSQPACPDSEVQ